MALTWEWVGPTNTRGSKMKFNLNDLVVLKTALHPRTNYCVYSVAIIYEGSYLLKFHGDVYQYESKEVDTTYRDEYESKPGTRSWREGLQRYQEDELFSLEEAAAEWDRISNVKDQMEKDFIAVKSQVEEKMKAAAALVAEANALVLPLDKDLCDLTKECMPLYNALDNGGWRSSNFRC